MSTSQTTNLHLVKPDDSEYPDVSVINGNMDTIDAKMGAVGSTDLQSQIYTSIRLTKLNSAPITIANNSSADLPSGYFDATGAMITGYGYNGMRFTHIGNAGSINLMVAASATTIGVLEVNSLTGKITNASGTRVTVMGIYKVDGL